MLQIRNATRDDAPLIGQFIRELAEYERLSAEAVVTDAQLRESLFGPRPAAEVLIALLDDHPVGFALFFQNFSTFRGRPGLYLEDLFVRPMARSQGVGRALLARLAQIALERNYGRMEWAVLNWNQPAIAFYETLGAKPMSDWIIYRLTGTALNELASRLPQSQ